MSLLQLLACMAWPMLALIRRTRRPSRDTMLKCLSVLLACLLVVQYGVNLGLASHYQVFRQLSRLSHQMEEEANASLTRKLLSDGALKPNHSMSPVFLKAEQQVLQATERPLLIILHRKPDNITDNSWTAAEKRRKWHRYKIETQGGPLNKTQPDNSVAWRDQTSASGKTKALIEYSRSLAQNARTLRRNRARTRWNSPHINSDSDAMADRISLTPLHPSLPSSQHLLEQLQKVQLSSFHSGGPGQYPGAGSRHQVPPYLDKSSSPLFDKSVNLTQALNEILRVNNARPEVDEEYPDVPENDDNTMPQPIIDELARATRVTNATDLCPLTPPNLKGLVEVHFDMPSQEELVLEHPELLPGGRWRPHNCTARQRVAIIIPYRDREEHLRIFLAHMHPFLQKQYIEYGIYIIEQAHRGRFNRAMLMNIGFVEANKLHPYDCFIFHDVDLLPEDDRNLYVCGDMPRHLSAAVDTMAYRLPYESIFGGVIAINKTQFELVNGFANVFFGWGGEDDDMYSRIQHQNLNVTRYPMLVARYRMVRHLKEMPSVERFKYLKTGQMRFRNDGVNSLVYRRKYLEERPLYTWLYVDIDERQVLRPHHVTEVPPGLLQDDFNMDAFHNTGTNQQVVQHDQSGILTEKRTGQSSSDSHGLKISQSFRTISLAEAQEVLMNGGGGGFTAVNGRDIERIIKKNREMSLKKALQKLVNPVKNGQYSKHRRKNQSELPKSAFPISAKVSHNSGLNNK